MLLLGAACATDPMPPAARHSEAIDEIQIMAMPVGLNLDDVPGVDGFAVKIYPINRRHPKSVPLQSGALDLLLFDGILDAAGIRTNAPLRTWTFDAASLPQYGGKTAIGFSYSFTLAWGTNTPRQSKITVAGRHRPRQGLPAYSAPTAIAVANQ
jgi:hypothetical protein